MYYIKWKTSLWEHSPNRFQRKVPYFKSLSYPHWGSLKEARGFNSEDEAKEHIRHDAPHWLREVEYIFIHPLNFAERCLRDA